MIVTPITQTLDLSFQTIEKQTILGSLQPRLESCGPRGDV